MNHIITLALATITLGACTSKMELLTKSYQITYKFRILDPVDNKMYFTNEYERRDGRLIFIDHEGALIDCSQCTAKENLHAQED